MDSPVDGPMNSPMDGQKNGFDVIVAGAGYVGLTAAVAIAQARPSLKVAVVDAAPADAWQRDGRASAIAAAAVRMLDALGCWEAIAPKAQAITDMVITDSRTADPVRPVFLTFEGEIAPGEAFAHMVFNRDMNGALRTRAATLGLELGKLKPWLERFEADGMLRRSGR